VPRVAEDSVTPGDGAQEPESIECREPSEGAPEKPSEAFRDYTEAFKMFGDETRVGILTELADGPRNVTAICEALGVKQPTISHHLGLLRATGLVIHQRRGKSVVYELDRERISELIEFLHRLA